MKPPPSLWLLLPFPYFHNEHLFYSGRNLYTVQGFDVMDRDKEDITPLLSGNEVDRKSYHSTNDNHSSLTDVRDEQESRNFALGAERRSAKPIEELPSVEIRSPGGRIDTTRSEENIERVTSEKQHQVPSMPESSVPQDQEQFVESREPVHEEIHQVECELLTYIDNRDYGRELDEDDYLVRNEFILLRNLSVSSSTRIVTQGSYGCPPYPAFCLSINLIASDPHCGCLRSLPKESILVAVPARSKCWIWRAAFML